MNPERWELVAKIFDAALDQAQSARKDFVQQGCEGDEELEAEVLRLLAADEQAGSFLERQPFSITETAQAAGTSSQLATGTTLAGRFKLLRFIGQGGMGQVYEALDLELRARVALKTIRPDISSDPRMLSRFRREVQITHRITHPNVCRIFDIDRHMTSPGDGTDRDITFLTMELLEGETLANFLSHRGRLTTHEALPLVAQMIEGMSAAHAVGIVHRDFKPLNVLLVPATASSSAGLRAVVTDFGLARAVIKDAQVTEPGASFATEPASLMGTLVYMAPEQIERGEATVATDIYSLGLVMYEIVTGQRPFADDIRSAEATKRIKQPAPSPKLLVPDIDPTWEAAISKCLDIEPGKRFKSVSQVADEISPSSVSGSRLPSTQTYIKRTQAGAPAISRRRNWAVGIALLLGALALFAIGIRHYIRATPIQFAERDWVLVTDFTNHTGEKLFDRVVRDLAVQSLSQSTYVNIVPRLSAIEAAKRTGLKEVGSIDEQLGQEICLRENYKALLAGGIFKEGPRYLIAIKLKVPGKEGSTVSDSERIQSPDELFSAIDHIITRLRQTLGEPVSRIERSSQPLAQVTTRSIEALQRYSVAMDLYGARQFVRSINLANDAVEQDPDFAMAHLLLGRGYEQIGNDTKAATEFEKARADSGHVSERERYSILAAQYAADLENEKAAQEYQHLLDVYPDDVDALRQFAIAVYYSGYPGRAIEAQRRALTLSPNDPGCFDYLMELLVRTNQFNEALAVFEQARSRNVESSGFWFLAAIAAWGNGDLEKARRLLETPGREGSDYAEAVSKLYLGKLLAYQGRVSEAVATFQSGLGLARRPGSEDWASVFYYQLAKAEVARGDQNAAKLNARKSARIAKSFSNTGGFAHAGTLAIELLDLKSAQKFADLIKKQSTTHSDSLSEMRLHVLRGQIDLAQGRADKAVLEERLALDVMKSYEPLLPLAQACEQVRDWNCSIEAYSKYLDHKGEVLRYEATWDWVATNYRLARVYGATGNHERAIEYGQRFLDLSSSADTSLPVKLRAIRDMKRWKDLAN